MHKLSAFTALVLFLVACNAGTDAELGHTLASKLHAKDCVVTLQEDINGTKPKVLLVEINEARPDNYDLDLQIMASRVAYYITDSVKNEKYSNVKDIIVKFYFKSDTVQHSVKVADAKHAHVYINKAARFVKAFNSFDTLTANQLINYRYIPQEEMHFSMETPMLQKDTFGVVNSITFLGYKGTIVERNNTPAYEVRFAVSRGKKVTELYQVLMDVEDTLVDGYSWQFPPKK